MKFLLVNATPFTMTAKRHNNHLWSISDTRDVAFLTFLVRNAWKCDWMRSKHLARWMAVDLTGVETEYDACLFLDQKEPNVLFPPWINVLIWRVSIGSPMATAPKKRILFILVFAVQFHDRVVEHGRMWIVPPPELLIGQHWPERGERWRALRISPTCWIFKEFGQRVGSARISTRSTTSDLCLPIQSSDFPNKNNAL